jgi:hypothetical protein
MKQIRRGAYRSVAQLKAGIQEFIDAHQENPTPFVWTNRPTRSWRASLASPSGQQTRGPHDKCHEPLVRDTSRLLKNSALCSLSLWQFRQLIEATST